MLSHVLTRIREPVTDLVSDHSRDTNPAALGERLQSRRDIHTVAKDVMLLDDYVAQIDPDAEPDAPLVGHLRFAIDHPALDLHSAAHGVHYTEKFRQHAIASIFDDAA